ncbi:hypothetical protein ACP70R_030962 [Stipagrostis hirtigluma subsp. patula]
MAMARVAVASLLLLVAALTAARCCALHVYYVGDRDGWRENPAEPFNVWATRHRFQVNDRLVFRYDQEDSVLVVSQKHYDACDTDGSQYRLGGGGDSVYALNKSGHFFFISGDTQRCLAGERLVVIVMEVRNASSNPVPVSSPPLQLPPPPSPSAPLPPSNQLSPPAERNSSTRSPSSPVPTPGTNEMSSKPSAASGLSVGVLACLMMGGATILVWW